MNLWLDDMRKNPDGWMWAKDYYECINAFYKYDVVNASLDHDLYLGGFWDDDHWNQPTKTGFDVVEWIAEHEMWPETLAVHSDNVKGVARMCDVIEEFGPYVDKTDVMYDHMAYYVGGPKYL